MYKFTSLTSVFLLLSSGLNSPLMAHEVESHYDRIHLSANATSKIENDMMLATVYAVEEGSDATVLSTRVNTRILNALQLVKKYPAIKHQTNSYTSNPVYSNSKIKGWRVSQSLRLESKDMALMSDVLGKLQDDLALQSMQFTVSPGSKNQQDEILIDEAIASFEKRALQVAKKLRRSGYKIVDINISTSGTQGGVRPQFEMRAMSVSSLESAPAVSAGEQTVIVSVSGTIELE